MTRKKRRGISLGTYILTLLCIMTLFLGAMLFVRISGDFDTIALNPKMLNESFDLQAQSIINTEPENQSMAKLPFNQPTQAPAIFSTIPPAPTEPPTRILTINAAGQITIGDELRRSARIQSGGYDFSTIFEDIAPSLSGANLNIATLRTTVVDSASKFDNYMAPKELVEGMKSNGFLLFNLATDRMLDRGMSGLSETRAALLAAQVTAAGGYVSAEEREALPVKEINGIPVGILSYTSSISSTGKKAASDAEIQTATRLLDVETAKEDIAALRSKGAAVVIVLVHWGNRSDTKASKDIKAMASALVDAGADIILGTNPTQVHEIERRTVQRADGRTSEVMIAYSLGNFLVDDTREASNITGMVLHIAVEWNTQTNNLTIQDAWYMPTWIMRWKDNANVNRYRIIPAGIPSLPQNMTQTVHNNMNKAYQSVINSVGATAATPRME